MYYNPYGSSILSIRYKGPVSYSFNECSYYKTNTYLSSSSQSCCCVCCYASTNFINPRLVCGSRQSSLIHWSSSRTTLLLPSSQDPCRKCYCGYVKERTFRPENAVVGSKERKFRRMVSEGRYCDFENAEMMLSLLIEEVGEERYGVTERYCGLFETNSSNSDRFSRKQNENAGSLRSKYGALRVESRKNEAKSRQQVGRKCEDEEVRKGERHKGRKSGSSRSAYYTCSSLGQDSERDSEILVENETYAEESSEMLKWYPKVNGKAVYEGEIKENLSGVGSYKMIESNCRKKSEKKLDEVAIIDVSEVSYCGGLNSHKQFDTADNKSLLVSVSETRQKYSRRKDETIGGYESTRKQKQFMQTCENDVEAVSSSTKLFSGRDEKLNLAGSYVFGGENEHLKTEDRVSQRDDYRLSIETSNKASQIEDINLKRISNFHYEDSVKKQEDRYLQDTEKGYYLKNEEDSRKMFSRRKFRQSSEISDNRVSQRDDHRSSTKQSSKVSQIVDMNVRRTNISQGQYEDKVKIREDQSSVIQNSAQDTGNLYYLKGEEYLRQMDSGGKFTQAVEMSDDHVSRRDDYRLSAQHSDKISPIHDANVKKTNISHAQYEDKVKRQEDRSSVVSSSVQDSKNRYYLQREEDLRLMNSEKESQQSIEISAQAQHVQSGRQVGEQISTKGSLYSTTITLGESGDTQVNNTHKTSENRIGSDEKYSSMVVKSTEESKKIRETSNNQVLRFESPKETGVRSHKPSNLQASLTLETTPTVGSNSQEIVITPESRYPSIKLIAFPSTVEQIQNFENPLTSFSHEDALGSARRFQKSSSKIVDEFFEMVTYESSTSHREMEKNTSNEKMLVKGHKHEEKSSCEYAYFDFKSKEQESRRSTGSSGVKGPSVEIWDEMAPSTREPVDVRTQVPEGIIPSHNIIVKRTGRSLWNIFSDIVKVPWSSRSRTSTQKSGVKNSPDQSSKSEAWFSSHDRDETSDENMKRRNESMSHESIPSPTQYQGEGDYTCSSSKKKICPGKSPIGSTTPKGSSSVSSEENFEAGGSTMMETSVSMPSLRIRKSRELDHLAEVDTRTIISASGSLTGKEQVAVSSSINVKATVGGDIKRRMLQRTNQVIKDRFDDWEEAFSLETEQRKIDEEFMREALLEAKKAGDMWEVPVGAVLVQHGKIIARGYNLVEELRDSTAHAEMICIREGSNQLRTWRLADTTLYVTLEPCPMCAGAILQARVDTVVWGAPNKLLGADGSWIRLFPGGGEGGTSSESTDKPPAPVHPFHPKIVIRRGVLGTECADVMQQFFQLRRRKKGNKQLPDMPPTPPSCLPISNHPTKILYRMQDAFHFMFCL